MPPQSQGKVKIYKAKLFSPHLPNALQKAEGKNGSEHRALVWKLEHKDSDLVPALPLTSFVTLAKFFFNFYGHFFLPLYKMKKLDEISNTKNFSDLFKQKSYGTMCCNSFEMEKSEKLSWD